MQLLTLGMAWLPKEMLLDLLHRPKAREELVREETLLYVNISRVLDISIKQGFLFFGREHQIQRCLC
ncbi:hypothetical protein AC629_17780 [Bradyrhizobium sp. NAS80.1]|nr:hypothetical protein AC629_17780 [Bradyrhizobium sp. NAS80.1]